MVAKAWEDIRPESLMCAWNRVLVLNNGCQPETMPCDIEIVETTITIDSEHSLSAAEI